MYWALKDIMKGDFHQDFKKCFKNCVLPIVTYGSQTWPLTETEERKIETRQNSVKKVCLVSRSPRKRIAEVPRKTGLRSTDMFAKQRKWDWTGHAMRMRDAR